MTESAIIPLTKLCRDDTNLAGGKGANLGELTRAGAQVPPGFVVTSDVYFRVIDDARPRIAELTSGLNPRDSAALAQAASAIQELIMAAAMPDDVAAAIRADYAAMGGGFVAVRSSATAEDLAEASFAGQQSSYLDVSGEDNVVRAVRRCWASLFEPRAMFYREQAGFGHLDVGIAVVVQQMVDAERSGVMFTVNPVNGDHSSMVIEAIFGLGEAVVSGMVTPDTYIVEKVSGVVTDCQVGFQEQELVRNRSAAPGEEQDHWLPVDFARRTTQKLSDGEIAELAAVGRSLEAHFGCAQDIEWAHDGSQFYVVQARPVTAIG